MVTNSSDYDHVKEIEQKLRVIHRIKMDHRAKERDFYSHKAGNQKGHAHQTWCLLFSNVSMI